MHTKFTKFMLLLCSINLGFSQLFIAESFADPTFPPSGWTLNSVGSGNFTFFRFGSVPNQSVAIIESSSIAQNEELISPTFDLSNTSVCFLDFRGIFRRPMFVDDNVANFIVSISTNNGSSWTPIWDDSQIDYGSLFIFSQPITVDISTYTGAGNSQVKLKFNFTSIVHSLNISGGNSFQLFYANASSCQMPVITSAIPNVTWTVPDGFTGTFDLEYVPVGSNQGSGTLITGITGNTYQHPDFDCNSYDIFVRANCGTSQSTWSSIRRQHVVGPPFAQDITGNSARIRWNGIAGSTYMLEYGPQGFTEGTGVTISGVNTTFPNVNTTFFADITNLNPCTNYTVRVKNQCSTTDLWSVTSFLSAAADISPLSIPFTEPFDEPSTICSLGFTQSFTVASVTNNELVFPFAGTDFLLRSRTMTLNANQVYIFKIDARTVTSLSLNDPTSLGRISLYRSIEGGGSSLVTQLFSLNSNQLSNSFTNFTVSFPVTTAGVYFLGFQNLTSLSSLAFKNLEVTTPLSATSQNAVSAMVYPNPTTSTIHVQLVNDTVKQVQLFDFTGKMLRNTTRTEMDLRDIPTGVYLLKIESNTGIVETHRVVKN